METSAQETDRLVAGVSADERKGPYDLSKHFWLAYPAQSDQFAAEVVERFGRFASRWREGTDPISHAIMESYRMYHGLQEYDTSPVVDLQTGGEHDEFLRLFINEYRGLIRHQNSLMTTERPAWDVQARTSGSKAAKQVTLARNLLDWLMGAKGYEKIFADAAEYMRVMGAAYIAQGWNVNGGPKGQGDIWRTVLAVWECATEDVREYGDTEWWIFPRWESRWGWVSHFAKSKPQLAERLSNHTPGEDMLCSLFKSQGSDNNDADRIPLLYLYANPSRACPLGRVAIVAGAEGELVLQDGPSPYGEVPIRRMCAAEFVGTSIPYGNSWTMLPIQKAMDVCWGAVISRIDMHGIPNVAVQDGMEFEASDLSGANVIRVPPGADLPQGLDLMKIDSALPKSIEALGARAEAASGINSVTRGQPTENITSGSMAALVASQAQQFNSADERAYVTTMEAVGTDALRIFQKCATEPQIISIVGQDERYSTREFKGEDLNMVQRVAIKVGNALSRNIAGRTEIIQWMLNNKLVEDPREVMEFLETGQIRQLYAGPAREVEMIKSENEALQDGREPKVSPWDNHELHIREHRCELDTDARYDDALSARINKHLDEHMLSWQRETLEAPDLLAAKGMNPLPAAQAAAGQAAAMGGGAAPPQQPGPPPVKTPNAAEPPKSQPGPKAQPPGNEPSQAAPSMPSPAQPPPEVIQ